MPDEEAAPYLHDAADAFPCRGPDRAREHRLRLDQGRYFVGAWARSHTRPWAHKMEVLNETAQAEAFLVPEDRQMAEIGSATIAAAW